MLILANNWWMFVLRGVLAILFGILTILLPGMALLTLVLLFGFYAMLDGIFAIVAGVRRGRAHEPHWWALLLHGILGIAAGIIAFAMPALTAIALLFLIAGWAIVTGILQIIAAIRLRRHMRGEWLLILTGVVSLIFGVLIGLFPSAGALAVLLWIGAFAIASGVLLISLGFHLRKWLRTAPGDQPGHGFSAVAPGH